MRAQKTPAELLVGLDVADDAAVYLVTPDTAIVETLDFFPPIVDDAYASGAIAAANAMSDVYAMGGDVLFALQIAAWPEDAPLEQLERIFAGAVDTASEAGVELRIAMRSVPLLPGARAHALGTSFGGLERNQAHFLADGRVRFEIEDEALRILALDPQTSGGLLVGVPAQHADAWSRALRARDVEAARIGEVVAGSGVTIAE